ncbi:MAG: F420-dependent methylenetetrahydromethanopterin dehydrogenase [Euryarchaeota archaeon]|nr:F420-dependent methylenetetrahydromethanopterin dehydrogenase [Euryarchaeota archaeon]
MLVRVGVIKSGAIGTSSLLDLLLDERAERKDLDVRVISSGAKMGPEQTENIIKKMLEYKPELIIWVSPNLATHGPTKAREILSKCAIPTIMISDAVSIKIKAELEQQGLGYILIKGDPMIGARREFLDPTEMAIFNSDIIKVLAITGAFRVVQFELDGVIDSIKARKKPELPKIIIDKELAVKAADFSNPYAKAKAVAAYEMAERVAALDVEGCFILKEREKYIPIVAAAHEILRYAAKLVDEAHELEKGNDEVLRTPHDSEGKVLRKRKLLEKPV